MKKPLLMILAPVVLGGILIGAYLLYGAFTSGAFDERLQSAIQSAQEPRSYEMRVETATMVSDRTIRILGLYKLDPENKQFGSYATTTLTIPDMPVKQQVHIFTLQNIASNDDVFVKIETTSSLLKKSIPHSPDWRHFTSATIPPQFKDIAVVGPVLDSLALVSEHGTYLSLAQKPVDVTMGSSTLHVYTFKLSKKTQETAGGTLKSLLQRIATGTVDVLIDDTPSIRGMVVHGDNYVSTTTILSVNTPVIIDIPTVSE